MLAYIILGLLRGGSAAHGYQLALAYQARAGVPIATSSFYRDLARLRADALVEITPTPPGTDGRRIPHRITERGRLAFDRWLRAPIPAADPFDVRAIFLDRVPAAHRPALCAQWRRELFTRTEQRQLEHECAVARRQYAGPGFDPLPAVLERDLHRARADVALLDRLSREFDTIDAPTEAIANGCATS